VSLPDAFTRVLERRGTRRPGASPTEIADLTKRQGDLPEAVLTLLRLQNGEDPTLTFGKSYRFMAADEVAESMKDLKVMVEEEETLPRLFLEFVPFMHTEVKTEIGVFRCARSGSPRGVVEYHYETGEFIEWSANIDSFIVDLALGEPPFDNLGSHFPAPGLNVVDVSNVP
jgi:hypothetical protein